MKLAGFLVLLLIACNFAVLSQKNEAQFEVKVNALIVDSNKQYAFGLRKEEVKLFEDGIEQMVVSVKERKLRLNLGMVFDNSGSIRKKLDEIIEGGRVIISNLSADDEAFVVRFTHSDVVEIIQDYTNSKTLLSEAIGNMYVDKGQTALLDAVYLSAGKLLERRKSLPKERYAMVLFSDGEDRDSFYKINDVLKLLKDTDLQIFFVSYANFAPEFRRSSKNLSHILAFETGGVSYILPEGYDGKTLEGSLKSLMYELRSQYVIGYTPTNQKRDGQTRKLTIQIADSEKGEKRDAIIRESLIVPN